MRAGNSDKEERGSAEKTANRRNFNRGARGRVLSHTYLPPAVFRKGRPNSVETGDRNG